MLLRVFHAGEALFHTGWFVESLATQTLVLFVIRTPGNPLRSRPSLPLVITVLAVVVIALVLPFTPLAGGCSASCRCRRRTSLPARHDDDLSALVELVKRAIPRPRRSSATPASSPSR